MKAAKQRKPKTKQYSSEMMSNIRREPESAPRQKTPSFVESTSKLTGKSPTIIREEIEISKNLTPEVKEIPFIPYLNKYNKKYR